jgi:pimeloyl-ACP methyl ester carboxylesterase
MATTHAYNQNPSMIPYHSFGGEGEVVHFAHANGYPPEAYKQLLDPVTQEYQVIGMMQRPLWEDSDYTVVRDWHMLADDLILFLDAHSMKDIVGIGHSLGGVVSVLAADKRPDLFKKLILIEPVIFPKLMTSINHLMPMFLRKKYVPVAKVALNRRDHWDTEQEIFDSYRKKRIFSLLSDETIWDWIRAGIVRDKEGGVTLRFTKQWEAHIYATVTNVLDALDRLKMPFFIMRGEKTNVISDNTWSKLHKKFSDKHLIEYKNTTHLLPLEKPALLAKDIQNIINNN